MGVVGCPCLEESKHNAVGYIEVITGNPRPKGEAENQSPNHINSPMSSMICLKTVIFLCSFFFHCLVMMAVSGLSIIFSLLFSSSDPAVQTKMWCVHYTHSSVHGTNATRHNWKFVITFWQLWHLFDNFLMSSLASGQSRYRFKGGQS